LSRVSPADPVMAYRHGAVLIIGFFVAAGAVSAVLLTGRPAPAPGSAAPAPADGATGVPVPAVARTRER